MKQRQVGPGVTPDDARDDLAVVGARADLVIRVEKMVGDEERLRIDHRAGGRAPPPAAQEHETRGGPGGRAREIVRKLLCK